MNFKGSVKYNCNFTLICIQFDLIENSFHLNMPVILLNKLFDTNYESLSYNPHSFRKFKTGFTVMRLNS